MTESKTTPTEFCLGITARGRLPELRRCIHSARSLAGDVNLHIIVAFDDDQLGCDVLEDIPGVTKINYRPRHYLVQLLNQLYSAMKATYPNMDHCGIVDDDMEFLRYGWAESVIEGLSESTGVIDVGGQETCAATMTRKSFIEDNFDGYWRDPSYVQFYHDQEFLNTLKDMNKIRWVLTHPRNSNPGAVNASVPSFTAHHYSQETHGNWDILPWKGVDFNTYRRRCEENEWFCPDTVPRN